MTRKTSLSDLDTEAIDAFRVRWFEKARSQRVLDASREQLLRDAELLTPKGVTYAALILLGTHSALGEHLAQAETIFEYRSSEAPGPASQREEFGEGFLLSFEPRCRGSARAMPGWRPITLRANVSQCEPEPEPMLGRNSLGIKGFEWRKNRPERGRIAAAGVKAALAVQPWP